MKFPLIKVRLVGEDGNAFAILGRMSKALKKGGATPEQVKEFFDQAQSGDYNKLLQTCMEWVDVQ